MMTWLPMTANMVQIIKEVFSDEHWLCKRT